MKHKQQYKTRAGTMAWRPSLAYLMAIPEHGGFCLACGDDTSDGVEPDAKRYTCPHCGEDRLYGRESIVMMGLTY